MDKIYQKICAYPLATVLLSVVVGVLVAYLLAQTPYGKKTLVGVCKPCEDKLIEAAKQGDPVAAQILRSQLSDKNPANVALYVLIGLAVIAVLAYFSSKGEKLAKQYFPRQTERVTDLFNQSMRGRPMV